jgi:hypothetical protein
LNIDQIYTAAKRTRLASEILSFVVQQRKGYSPADIVAALDIIIEQLTLTMPEQEMTASIEIQPLAIHAPDPLSPEKFVSIAKEMFQKHVDSLLKANVPPMKGDSKDEPNKCTGHCDGNREGS